MAPQTWATGSFEVHWNFSRGPEPRRVPFRVGTCAFLASFFALLVSVSGFLRAGENIFTANAQVFPKSQSVAPVENVEEVPSPGVASAYDLRPATTPVNTQAQAFSFSEVRVPGRNIHGSQEKHSLQHELQNPSNKSEPPAAAPSPSFVSQSSHQGNVSSAGSTQAPHPMGGGQPGKPSGKEYTAEKSLLETVDQFGNQRVIGALLRRLWREHERVGADMRVLLREYLVALEKELYVQQAETFGLEKLKMDTMIHNERSNAKRHKEAEIELRALQKNHNFMKALYDRLKEIPRADDVAAVVNRIQELDKPADIAAAVGPGTGTEVNHALKMVGRDLRQLKKSFGKLFGQVKSLEASGHGHASPSSVLMKNLLRPVMDPKAGPVSSLNEEVLPLFSREGLEYMDKVDDEYTSRLDQPEEPLFGHDLEELHGQHPHHTHISVLESNEPHHTASLKTPWKEVDADEDEYGVDDGDAALWIDHHGHRGKHHRHHGSLSVHWIGSKPMLASQDDDFHNEQVKAQHDDEADFPGLFFLELEGGPTGGVKKQVEGSSGYMKTGAASAHRLNDQPIHAHRGFGESAVEELQDAANFSFLQTAVTSESDGDSEEAPPEGESASGESEGKPSGEEEGEKAKEGGGDDATASEGDDHSAAEEHAKEEHATSEEHGKKEEGNGCIDIDDPKKCIETDNCFHDDVYHQCFFNCTMIAEADKCNEHANCRYEKILPKNSCVNQGYQSVSLSGQSFEGIMRGCEEFRDKESCTMMEKATQRLKDAGITVTYDCHWLEAGPEATPSEGDDGGQEKIVGKEEAAEIEGGRSVCVNRKEAPTAEKLLWGTVIAEKEKKLKELETSRNVTADKVCIRPRELAGAKLQPDRPFYAVGDQVSVSHANRHRNACIIQYDYTACKPALNTRLVECMGGSSFLGTSKLITCHAEGAFEPQVACVPTAALSSQQQTFMRKIQEFVEADQTLAGMGTVPKTAGAGQTVVGSYSAAMVLLLGSLVIGW
ncbi:rhoptry neck protein [Cystoisospora suis]|uniref:Rhoptry neck protein n=1 Tax=Cystoisospora suis TaxID=483139 RepID=A0A2C6JCV9_9APIC|nr:rhoptry neck protein [Cystoisospora suis]